MKKVFFIYALLRKHGVFRKGVAGYIFTSLHKNNFIDRALSIQLFLRLYSFMNPFSIGRNDIVLATIPAISISQNSFLPNKD
jgi:hypothetical protein